MKRDPLGERTQDRANSVEKQPSRDERLKRSFLKKSWHKKPVSQHKDRDSKQGRDQPIRVCTGIKGMIRNPVGV